MSKIRKIPRSLAFYINTTPMKKYYRARFWKNMELRHINKVTHQYLTQKNRPDIKQKLADAIHKERIKRRRQQRRQERINAFNNANPIIENSLVLKYCIVIVLIMTILSFNLTGQLTIETQIENPPYNLQEINYTQTYKNSFYDERTALDGILRMGEALTIFGQNTAWAELINEFANKDSENTIIQITKVVSIIVFLPLNEVINIGTLFINLINSWIGRQMIQPTSFKLVSILETQPIDMLYLPNLFKNVFG